MPLDTFASRLQEILDLLNSRSDNDTSILREALVKLVQALLAEASTGA